jgi:hypothetical protein
LQRFLDLGAEWLLNAAVAQQVHKDLNSPSPFERGIPINFGAHFD